MNAAADRARARLPSSRWRGWIAIAVGLKALLFVYLRMHTVEPGGTLYHAGGDTWSYFDPIENLLKLGEYIGEVGYEPSRAGRLPGYGATYLLFRAFTTPHLAKTCLVVAQAIVSGVSVYALARVAEAVSGRVAAFYVAFAIYGASSFVSMWDYQLLTESLAASALIFSWALLVRYRSGGGVATLIGAGAFFCYCVFLRPFIAPLVLAGAWVAWRASPSRARVLRTALFVLPLALCDGAWTARNLSIYHRLVPFQLNTLAAYKMSPADDAVWDYTQAVGGELVYWTPGSLAAWLREDAAFHDERWQPPPYVYGTSFGEPELRAARSLYTATRAETDPARKAALDRSAAAAFASLTAAYRHDRPWQFWAGARLRYLARLTIHAGPGLPLPGIRGLVRHPVALAFKLVNVALYWIALIGGIGGLWAFRKVGAALWALVAGSVVFQLGFFAFILRSSELRFETLSFPGLCVVAATVIAWRLGPEPAR